MALCRPWFGRFTHTATMWLLVRYPFGPVLYIPRTHNVRLLRTCRHTRAQKLSLSGRCCSIFFTGNSDQQNAEALRQEFHGVHSEINSIKPRIRSDLDLVRADICDMRLEMRSVHESLSAMHTLLQGQAAGTGQPTARDHGGDAGRTGRAGKITGDVSESCRHDQPCDTRSKPTTSFDLASDSSSDEDCTAASVNSMPSVPRVEKPEQSSGQTDLRRLCFRNAKRSSPDALLS